MLCDWPPTAAYIMLALVSALTTFVSTVVKDDEGAFSAFSTKLKARVVGSLTVLFGAALFPLVVWFLLRLSALTFYHSVHFGVVVLYGLVYFVMLAMLLTATSSARPDDPVSKHES